MTAENPKNIEGLEHFLQMMKGKSIDVLADPSGYIHRLSHGQITKRKSKNSQNSVPSPQHPMVKTNLSTT